MATMTELRQPVNTVRGNIQDLTQSGQYYCTDEMYRELSAINSGLEHIKLDSTITNSSKDWQKRYNPQHIYAGTQSTLNKAGSLLNDIKVQMSRENAQNLQENELREVHHWTMENLRDYQHRDLAPHSHGACERLQQFSDHIGVTDRYTGYRHNLTRPREQTKLRPGWKDQNGYTSGLVFSSYKGMPTQSHSGRLVPPPGQLYGMVEPAYLTGSLNRSKLGNTLPSRVENRGYQTIDSLYPRSTTMYINPSSSYSQSLQDVKAMNALNASSRPQTCPTNVAEGTVTRPTLQRAHTTMSIQEQCGINTNFPGKTEYTKRYCKPCLDMPTSHFIINPTPDFTIHGRPLGRTRYDQAFTEYQKRYEWPDGSKITRLPWRRT